MTFINFPSAARQHALTYHICSYTTWAVICLRNSAFLNDEELVNTVPKHIRARFIETDPANKSKMAETKKQLYSLKPACVVSYKVTSLILAQRRLL